MLIFDDVFNSVHFTCTEANPLCRNNAVWPSLHSGKCHLINVINQIYQDKTLALRTRGLWVCWGNDSEDPVKWLFVTPCLKWLSGLLVSSGSLIFCFDKKLLVIMAGGACTMPLTGNTHIRQGGNRETETEWGSVIICDLTWRTSLAN